MNNSKRFNIFSIAVICLTLLLVLVPFFAPISIWPASNFGHYVLFRLWDEVLLAIAAIVVLITPLKQPAKIMRTGVAKWVIGLSIAYALFELVIGSIALFNHQVSKTALGEAWILNFRLLVAFWLGVYISNFSTWIRDHWQQILLIPAAIVVVFGLLQVFVLPNNILQHIGYGPQTIKPYETINNNPHYIRILATLRGANPLGAYLVVVIGFLSVVLLKAKTLKMRILVGIFGVMSLAVLYYSFSRSAWIGAVLAVIVVVFVSLHSRRLQRYALFGFLALLLVGVLGIIGAQHSKRLDNIFFHTQNHSSSPISSDQAHFTAMKQGLIDVIHQPLGGGPGTAGPASYHNKYPPRIAENYFIQVAQEIGIAGLLVFLGLNVLIAYVLWTGRKHPLHTALLATLVGVTFVNLLSHAWTDDTLSIIWWTFAGVACSATILKAKHDNTTYSR